MKRSFVHVLGPVVNMDINDASVRRGYCHLIMKLILWKIFGFYIWHLDIGHIGNSRFGIISPKKF